MCTAISYKTGAHYFGRNLDLDFIYDESVTVVPRKYCFDFRKAGSIKQHFAMIGMAYVVDDYPLFYDATNEKGLSMAGLNFPGLAHYEQINSGEPQERTADEAGIIKEVAPFEFIAWILAQCSTVSEAKKIINSTRLVDIRYNENMPNSPLHWIIADKDSSITVEPLKSGIKVYENQVGVLTNNPTFDFHMMNLNNYINLTADEKTAEEEREDTQIQGEPEDRDRGSEWERFCFQRYCRGMGAIGLPGDWSSASRFVRAVFVKMNSVCGESEQERVSQFMHILGAVAMPRGSVNVGGGKYEITVYSSCCNTDEGIYYYTTYDDMQIRAVEMKKTCLDGEKMTEHRLWEK